MGLLCVLDIAPEVEGHFLTFVNEDFRAGGRADAIAVLCEFSLDSFRFLDVDTLEGDLLGVLCPLTQEHLDNALFEGGLQGNRHLLHLRVSSIDFGPQNQEPRREKRVFIHKTPFQNMAIFKFLTLSLPNICWLIRPFFIL